jgi:hypothetical protein
MVMLGWGCVRARSLLHAWELAPLLQTIAIAMTCVAEGKGLLVGHREALSRCGPQWVYIWCWRRLQARHLHVRGGRVVIVWFLT